MGFFSTVTAKQEKPGLPFTLLHEKRCLLCTLNNVHNKSPKMKPTGTNEPLILVMAEAPGEHEDIKGEQLVGPSGQLFRPLIPEKFRDSIRWDNVARCRPPQNRTPTDLEVECCREHHREDIENTKPFAIFGLGNVPLQWAIGQAGITKYRGRYIPIRIGSHTAWYFPFFHPSLLLRERRAIQGREIESENEFVTRLDIARAFKLIETLPDPVVYTEEEAKADVTCSTGHDKGDLNYVLKFLEHASNQKYAAIDYETQNLRPYEKDSRIISVAVSVDAETVAFPLDHPGSGWNQQQQELVRQAFAAFLLSPCHKIAHNLSFELEWTCLFFGRDKLRTNWGDTLSQAFVLDERAGCLSLDFLCMQYFGLNLKAISKHLNVRQLQNEPLDQVLLYNALDAKLTLRLHDRQLASIISEGLENAYAMQLRRIPTVVLTQIKGLPIDFEANKRLATEFGDRLKSVIEQIEDSHEVRQFKSILGRSFKPGSTRDVEALLSKVLNTRVGRKDTGRYSTDEDVLTKIGKPITKLILEYRKATKAISTYVEPYSPDAENSVIHDDGLIHPNYNTTFVTSGRLSSDSPNVQNIPNRDSNLRGIRTQFKPM